MYVYGMRDQLTRQQERSAETRRVLLDATVACLVEDGYMGTTSVAVATRAGLSRGAQLHHFGTRDQMVIAAIEHLAQKRLGAVRERLTQLTTDGEDGPQRGENIARAALQLLADALSGPLYAATLELWMAARANADLREQLVPAEHQVNAELRAVCRDWVTADPVHIQLTLDLLLGRGVSGMLTGYAGTRQHQALDTWARIVRERGAQ